MSINPFDEFVEETTEEANPFDEFEEAEQEYYQEPTQTMEAYEPGIVERALNWLNPPNREAASNELAAKEIAGEQGLSVGEVYDQAGGSRPLVDPQGRSGMNALSQGYQSADFEVDRATDAAYENWEQTGYGGNRGLIKRSGEALDHGWDNMVGSLTIGKHVLSGGNNAEMAKFISDKIERSIQQTIKRTITEQGIYGSLDAVNYSDGILETLSSGVRAAGEFFGNPEDAAVISAEQAPNMIPTVALGTLGGGVGVTVGGLPGAVAGGRIGMGIGSTATEFGAEVEQAITEHLGDNILSEDREQLILELLNNDEFISAAQERALKKGLTVAAMDQVFLGVSGRIATMPAKTAAKRTALGMTAVGADAVGEGAGEAASQYVSRGEVEKGDALLESLASGPTSIVETGIGAGMALAKKAGNKKEETATPEVEQPDISPEEISEPEGALDQTDINPFDEFEEMDFGDIEEQVEAPEQPQAVETEIPTLTERYEPVSEHSNETGIYRVKTEDIKVDPEQYQFRSKVNQEGVDNRLDGIEEWNESRAGIVTVHRRENGEMYVADGHHRVHLAKRLNQESINARFLDEKDGWTVEEVRTEAAMDNIANDKAEPLDVAKVIRNSGMDVNDVRKKNNLPNSQIVRDGQSLAQLNDDVFGLVVSGQLDEKDGAAIGGAFSQDKQNAATEIFQKVKPTTAYQRELLINEINAAEFAQSQGEQGGLFGDDPQEVSLMQDRLRVLDALRKQLNTDKRLFKNLNDNADRATEAGNQIAKETNEEITKQSQQSLDLISRVATTPALNELVNKAAKKVHDGESLSSVSKELRKELRNYERENTDGLGQDSEIKSHNESDKQTDGTRKDSRSSAAVPEGNARGADQEGESGTRESNQDGALVEGDQEPLLTDYSEEELQQRENEKKETEKAEKEKEAKANADDQVDDFQLTGSDRQADADPNQGDLLDSPQEVEGSSYYETKSEKALEREKVTPTGQKLNGVPTYEYPDGSIQPLKDDEVTLLRDDFDEVIPWGDKPSEFFINPNKTINVDKLTTEEISQEEANEIVAGWKAEAARIGREEDHSKEIVISLFDRSGKISQPWRDAGYEVVQYDIELGDDLMTQVSPVNLAEEYGDDYKVVGVIAQPPCTCFSSSGARWWKERHDAHDRRLVEEMFGPKAAEYFSQPKDYTKTLVAMTEVWIEMNDPDFFILENPIGRIATEMGMPKATLKFQPNNYGDPYTKETQLWGTFNTDLPTANVYPSEGSLMHKMWSSAEKSKGARSLTPEGFAYSFFMANKTESAQSTGQVEDNQEPVLEIKEISEKAFVVVGDTKPHKDRIKGMGAKWNIKHKGWMFPKKRLEEVQESLSDLLGVQQDKKSYVEDKETYVAPKPEADQSLGDYLYSIIDSINDNRDLKKAIAEYHAIESRDVTDAQVKEAQEAMEFALVKKARETVAQGKDDETTYEALVEAYLNQPNLNVRSSTSMENQAYSTPAPISFLASRMANIDQNKSVYEPTAGNGMLLIGANPEHTSVNELDPSRAANLEKLGFEVTQNDATTYKPEQWHDAAIMNPPFGKLRDERGDLAPVKYDGYTIKSIDHLITAKALEAIGDNGRATIIIGASKQAGEIGSSDKVFFNWLYSHYNVTDHFEIDGRLYNRQGAGWPIRVITVNGRVESGRLSPKSGSIERFDNWGDIYEHYQQGLDSKGQFVGSRAESVSSGSEQRPGDDRGDISFILDGQVSDSDNTGRTERNTQERDGDSTGLEQRSDDQSREGSSASANVDRQSAPDNQQSNTETREDKPRESAKPKSADTKQPSERSSDKPVSASSFQSTYQARSAGFNDAVLTPNNMAEPLQHAFSQIEKEVGNIDQYVMDKLGYQSAEEMHKAFMGLQVDAVAAAIYNFENKEKGVIIADQTGVGKGRQAAAIIRYAVRQGKTPIFVTVTDNLFTDMYDDLADIGSHNIRPFILNADSSIIQKGKKLFANKKTGHKALIRQLAQDSALPEDRNALFLTYSQINTPNEQRQLVRALRDNAIFILDESHNAAGEQVMIKKVKGVTVKQQTGAGLINEVIEDRPVLYLSATFAKRPDNMPVYYRTDLMDAVDGPSELVDAIAAGGVPLQTAMSGMLAKSGQLIRRERSFEGISIPVVLDSTNKDKHTRISDQVTEGLRAVTQADSYFHNVFLEDYREQAEQAGYDVGGAGNKASNTIDHTNFNAVVHNYVRQLLLSLKAEEAANKAIEAFKAGKKPVIALENTMGAFLSQYAKDAGIEIGGEINADYRDVMLRALERTRRLSVKNDRGDRKVVDIPLNALDPATRSAYEKAESTIKSLDLGEFPISPIDLMRQKLTDAGLSVAELTGRDLLIDYSGESPVLAKRPASEGNKRESVDRFNSGQLDALIINKSGSTGLSIHASEKFKDQKPRHMIVAQTMLDVNILVQMLGRINRTGQIELPTYELMGLDIPAEKRPLAASSRKMKSLNANTSANEESDSSLQVPDMYNKYGDQVVAAFIAENPEIGRMVDMSAESEASAYPDMALKFTGRMALLPVELQERIYSQIEPAYEEKIEYLTKTGQNDLIASTMDTEARILESKIVYEGKKPSTIFGGHTTLHKVSIKMQGKPPLASEVGDAVKETLADTDANSYTRNIIDAKRADVERNIVQMEARIKKANEDKQKYSQKENAKPETIGRLQDQIDKAMQLQDRYETHVNQMEMRLERFAPGTRHKLDLGDDNVIGVVTDIRDKHDGKGDPWASSKVKVRFMVNSGIRSIDIPLSDLSLEKNIYQDTIHDRSITLEEIFENQIDSNARELRYIATGNLIAGSAKLSGGRIVNFTDKDNKTYQGILMPKKYGEDGEFEGSDSENHYSVRDPKIAAKFLKENRDKIEFAGGIYSASKSVRITRDRRGWLVSVPKANKHSDANQVKFDKELIALTGDFYGSGKVMSAYFDESKLDKVVARVMELVPLYASPDTRAAWVNAGGNDKAEAHKTFEDGSSDTRFNISPLDEDADQTPIGQANADKVINKITNSWRRGREDVVLVDSFNDLPLDIKVDAYSQGASEKEVRGVFSNGKLYLVRENHFSSADLEASIFHEAYGHYGLRSLFGHEIETKLNALYVAVGGSVGLNRIAHKYGIDLTGYAKGLILGGYEYSREERNSIMMEELLAHMAENQKPSIMKKIKEILGAIRNWLRDKGFFNLSKYTDTDLFYLLKQSKRAVRESDVDVGGGTRFVINEEGTSRFRRDGEDQPTERETRLQKFFDGIAHQPIDRMFRVPFDVANIVDSHGRMKGSVKINEKTEYIIKEWTPHDRDQFNWMDNILEVARHGLIDRYKLSDEYKTKFREAEALGRGIDMQALDILKVLERNGVNGAEAAVLHKMLTGERIDDAHLSSLAAPILRAIDDLGLMAVEYGVITREQYERNRGEYLHRSYLKHEGAFTGISKWLMDRQRKHARKIEGKASKGRGIEIKVDMDRLLKHAPADWYGQKRNGVPDMQALNGRKFVVLENQGVDPTHSDTFEGMETVEHSRIIETIYWPTDIPRPAKYAGYRERGTFEVRRKQKGKVVLWRDYTKAERQHMGEILDARYNIAKTFQVISHDIAMGKFFHDVAQNEEWFIRSLPPNVKALSASEAKWLKNLSKVDWVQVPESVVSHSAGTKQWGALAGGYVRAEIWRDLNELDKMNNPGMWRKVLTQWKLNKTARSPVVHMNNVISNVMFMDLADVRMTDLIAGLKSYAKNDEHRRSAEEHGAFEGTFANEELRRKVMEPILDELMKQNMDATPTTENILVQLDKILGRAWSTLKKLDQNMTEFYQVEDEIFRMATYMRRLSLGDTPQEAARTAREQFLDYDIRAPWVNAARRTVLPFISYTYRAVPVLFRAVIERPWKVAKYYVLAQLAMVLAYEFEPGDEDEEYRTMRKDQQGDTWLQTPRMMRLPYKDEHGNPMFIDVRRWIPAGDVFDMNQGNSALPIPAPLQFGGPLMIASEFAINKQAFTGQEIVNRDTDTLSEAAAKTASWFYKSWMPSAAYIPGSYYWEKLDTAYNDGRDILGRPYSFPQALLSSLGIKVQPHDVKLGYTFRSKDLAAQAKMIKGDVRRAQMDLDRKIISKAEFNKIIASSKKKLILLSEEQRRLQGR